MKSRQLSFFGGRGLLLLCAGTQPQQDWTSHRAGRLSPECRKLREGAGKELLEKHAPGGGAGRPKPGSKRPGGPPEAFYDVPGHGHVPALVLVALMSALRVGLPCLWFSLCENPLCLRLLRRNVTQGFWLSWTLSEHVSVLSRLSLS